MTNVRVTEAVEHRTTIHVTTDQSIRSDHDWNRRSFLPRVVLVVTWIGPERADQVVTVSGPLVRKDGTPSKASGYTSWNNYRGDPRPIGAMPPWVTALVMEHVHGGLL